MTIIRCIFKWTTFVVEKVMWELAILAAIFSTTEPGTYVSRIVGGMADIVYAIYAFIRAYVLNVSFSDFMEHFKAAMMGEMGKFADNVEANPRMVLIAFIATFITYKVLSWLLGLFRRKLLCRRLKGEEPKKSHLHGGEGAGKTYEQLYDRPEPPPHDSE